MTKHRSCIWVLMGKIFFHMWVTSEAQSGEEFSFILSEVTSRRNNVGLCVSMYQFP